MQKIKVEHVVAIFSFALIVWALISWGEVLFKNTSANPVYWNGNLFKVILGVI